MYIVRDLHTCGYRWYKHAEAKINAARTRIIEATSFGENPYAKDQVPAEIMVSLKMAFAMNSKTIRVQLTRHLAEIENLHQEISENHTDAAWLQANRSQKTDKLHFHLTGLRQNRLELLEYTKTLSSELQDT